MLGLFLEIVLSQGQAVNGAAESEGKEKKKKKRKKPSATDAQADRAAWRDKSRLPFLVALVLAQDCDLATGGLKIIQQPAGAGAVLFLCRVTMHASLLPHERFSTLPFPFPRWVYVTQIIGREIGCHPPWMQPPATTRAPSFDLLRAFV